MGFSSESGFRSSFLKKLFGLGLSIQEEPVSPRYANPGTFANLAREQLAPCLAGRPRAPARPCSRGWPVGGPLAFISVPLCPLYLRLSRRPGGPLSLSLPTPAPPALQCPAGRGLLLFRRRRRTGGALVTADSDPRGPRLIRAPSGTHAGAPRASRCASARFRSSRGSPGRDGPGPGGGRAPTAGGRGRRRHGAGARARL